MQNIILKLSIFVLSFCFVDGGRSLSFFDQNIHLLITNEHSNDAQIPYQSHTINFHDEEKQMVSWNFCFSDSSQSSSEIPFDINFTAQEFLASIWQPPKSL